MKRIVLNLIRQVSLFEQKRTMQTSFPRLQSVEEVKQKKKQGFKFGILFVFSK